jgi:HEAT repeat protein
LPEAPWHLARNIISVLAEFPALVDVGPVVEMLEHPDLRVRQEALKLLVRVPEARDGAVAAALEGGEPALVRTALAALDGECPPQIVVPLIGLLAEGDDETRLQVIRLLDDANHPLAIGPLLNLVRSRSGLLRRWRLLPATPVMLAALGVLATRWPTHRPVVVTLQLAAHHDDPRVREAIGVFRGGEH